jgi:hypothetical protein
MLSVSNNTKDTKPMANSHAINSYRHERARLDTALNNPPGIDCPFDSINAAKAFVGRCNSLRRLLRATQIKPEDGTTYDLLRISRTDATVHIRFWQSVKYPDPVDPATGQPIPLLDVEEIMQSTSKTLTPIQIEDKPPLTLDDLGWKPVEN